MKVVASYDENNDLQPIPNMEGRKFKSYREVVQALSNGQSVTLQMTSGANKGLFKNVGIDQDGSAWVQRRFAFEY